MNNHPPVIDLHQLKREVLSCGAEAALPSNLSDHWLKQVSESLDQVLEVGDDESAKYIAGPMALVLHLLFGKAGTAQIEIDLDEMLERFRDYRLELALEEVSRHSDIKVAAATLVTIFTNRSVKFTPTTM